MLTPETPSVVLHNVLQHLTHAPVAIGFDGKYGVFGQRFQGDLEFHFISVEWDVLGKKDDEEGIGDITHALNIATGGVPHMPNEEHPLEEGLYDLGFEDIVELAANSLDVSFNGIINFFVVIGNVFYSFPIILNQLLVLLSLFYQSLFRRLHQSVLQ